MRMYEFAIQFVIFDLVQFAVACADQHLNTSLVRNKLGFGGIYISSDLPFPSEWSYEYVWISCSLSILATLVIITSVAKIVDKPRNY